jgi:hypothetical protein
MGPARSGLPAEAGRTHFCCGPEHGSGPAPNRVRQPGFSAATQPAEDSACVRFHYPPGVLRTTIDG